MQFQQDGLFKKASYKRGDEGTTNKKYGYPVLT
jgi:hypothetical protein